MLSDRQLLILQVIIDDFIRTAQPVGSRSIAKKEGISFSPATIRNEMADLEDLGFLEKTHSSSGRVPSEKGYRFYVDHLLAPTKLDNKEIEDIRSIFAHRIYELEKVVQKSAQILSDLTNYTSIVLGPQMNDTIIKQMQIIPISQDTAVALIVTDTGHVESRTITIPNGFNPSDLEKMANILNEKLKGVSLADLQDRLYSEVASLLKRHISDYEQLLAILGSSFDHSHKGEKIYFGGKTNMLSQPEFNDVGKIRSIMKMIEQEDLLYTMLKNHSKGISITIGHENQFQEMQDCSLITTTYSIGDQRMGTIAILGPTRMEYSRVVSLLDTISKDLSIVLTSMVSK